MNQFNWTSPGQQAESAQKTRWQARDVSPDQGIRDALKTAYGNNYVDLVPEEFINLLANLD